MKRFFRKNIWVDVAIIVTTILLVAILFFDWAYAEEGSGLWVPYGFVVIAVILLLQSLTMLVYAVYSLMVKKVKLGLWAIFYLVVLLAMAIGSMFLFGFSSIKW